MRQYLDLLKKIESEGIWKQNRTGIRTKSISGYMFEHNMKEGFPATTTKQLAFKSVRVELEGFIKGISSKKWYQDRGCTIWNEWANPKKVPYGTDEESKAKMLAEDDLGRIYGVQWRTWNSYIKETYYDETLVECSRIVHKPIDQLKNLVDTLKKNPLDRRMIVNAWNPAELDQMALPPCHYSFQVLSDGTNLDLLWNQRSCDVPLGIPFNIASYGLMLELLARESGLVANKLIGFLADCHIYENQLETAQIQIQREPLPLPKLEIRDFSSIFDWTYEQARLVDYTHMGKLDYHIAV